MKKIEIFDPAMCCSTGVCGPSVDPELARIAADLERLKKAGVAVSRYNLAHNAGAFVENRLVKQLLDDQGPEVLPVTLIDGAVYKTHAHLTRGEIEDLFGDMPEPPAPRRHLLTEDIRELIAIGAAVAANCEPCFRYHFDQARKLGVTKEMMREAVAVGSGVKNASAQNILSLADRYLTERKTLVMRDETAQGSCCESGSGEGCC